MKSEIALGDRLFYFNAISEYCHVDSALRGWVAASPAFVPISNQIADENRYGGSRPSGSAVVGDASLTFKRQSAGSKFAAWSAAGSCDGFREHPVSFDDVVAGWRNAAQRGEVRSIASLADLERRAHLLPADTVLRARGVKQLPGGPSLDGYKDNRVAPDPSAEDIEALKRAFQTGDPAIVYRLGPSLAESYEKGAFVFGERAETLRPMVRIYMWPLLACEYGLDCTPTQNMIVLYACFIEGICDMRSLEDYVVTRRFDAEDTGQYRRLKAVVINAFKSGDWRFIQYQLGADTMGATAMYNGFRTPLSPARW